MTPLARHVSSAILLLLSTPIVSARGQESPRPPVPTSKQLARMAPSIRNTKGTDSIHLHSYITIADKEINLNLEFKLAYQAPDRVFLEICDGVDGVPLFLAADNKAFVWDPVNSTCLVSQGARVRFDVASTPEAFHFALEYQLLHGRQGGDINVELLPMFDNDKLEYDVEDLGDGRYRLTQKRLKGGRAVAIVDPNRNNPFVQVELYLDDSEPFFRLDTIAVNEFPLHCNSAFPAEDGLARIATVKHVEDFAGSNDLFSWLTRVTAVRYGVRNPMARKRVESMFPEGIDWEKVSKADHEFALAIRPLLDTTNAPPK